MSTESEPSRGTTRFSNNDLKTVVAVVLALASGGGLGTMAGSGRVSEQLDGLKDEIVAVKNKLERLEERSQDRWTNADQRFFASELGRLNPTVNVPRVDTRDR